MNEQFINNFKQFQEFINSPATEYLINSLAKTDGIKAFKLIQERFNTLGLNKEV